MTAPAIITVAITGALPRKSQTPAISVVPSEQIGSTHEAYEAGAALVHIHVRDKDRLATSNAELVARVADICGEYDRYPATPKEAREILHLRPA